MHEYKCGLQEWNYENYEDGLESHHSRKPQKCLERRAKAKAHGRSNGFRTTYAMSNTSHRLSNSIVQFYSIDELLCRVGQFLIER